MNESTIAAIATPPGVGAVSLIRVSGSRAKEIADLVFRGRFGGGVSKPRRQTFGDIIDPGTQEAIDEVLVTFFPGPHSFTGEDTVEIACHGGIAVTEEVLQSVLKQGAEPAEPGEFSQRAFLNGRIDLTQAEAIMDLISAKTGLAARAAQKQLSGSLGDELEEIRKDLTGLAAHLEAWIDFPEEDIDPESESALVERFDSILSSIGKLLKTADQGRFLREGVRVVIAGAPNAGKSSLLNLLLGFDRAIVNQAPGTTRDTVEEVINLKGLPVRLIDTAGLREGQDEIEREGIERSHAQLSRADLILHMVDSSAPKQDWNAPADGKVLLVLNKRDLDLHEDWNSDLEGALRISCLEKTDRDLITERIMRLIVGSEEGLLSGNLVAINSRHQHCLEKAQSSLSLAKANLLNETSPEFAAMDVREALSAIGEIIGKTDIEEILGEIFSTFCIGK